jgi:alpha-ribazole phosphatase
MKGYRISIYRHGATKGNEDGLYIGQTDYQLSEAGKDALIKKAARYEYPRVGRVYSSPLMRCIETAEILFPGTGIVIADDLTEMNFGVFEELPAAELTELESYQKWIKGGIDAAPPNGESGRQVLTRCIGAMNAIIINVMNDDIAHAAIVTHSGIISNILSALGIPKYRPSLLTSDFGEGYEIIVTAQMWQTMGSFEILGKLSEHENTESIN